MCDWARDIGHCAQDGTGLILASGIAQNHQFYDINPNTAVGVSTTYAVPYEPVYNAAQQTALNAVGDVTGVAFSGGKVYSAYSSSSSSSIVSESSPRSSGLMRVVGRYPRSLADLSG